MEMESTVSFNELLAAVIRQWKKILASLLVFALLLGGYQAYQQISYANDPKNSEEKIEERYQTALENYEVQRENLQKDLENKKKSLASKEEYLEKSILLQIDPYDKYVANIVFTFSNIDESAQLFRYPNTAADYLPKKIRSQYIELWNSMDVPKDIGIAKYTDVEWKYLSELVSVICLEGELVSIQAAGGTAFEAEELADAIYHYFETHQEIIARSSASHTFALLNRTTKNVIDEGLETKRENLKAEIETLKEGIENTNQSIEDLEEPEREEGYPIETIIIAVVKYAVLGAAAGTLLACLFICCWWIIANRAANSFQLERAVHAPFLGSLKIPENLADRLADAAMRERGWTDREQALSYIREQTRANFPKEGKVLLLSTQPEEKVGAGMEELAETLSKEGHCICSAADALHNPKAVEALQDCAAVVFAERAGYSSLSAICSSAAQVKRIQKPVLGVITI